MRPRYIFATIGSVAVFFVILVMLAAGFIPPDAVSKISSQSAVNSQTPESTEIQVDAGTPHSSTPEPLASPVTPEQDGPSLLKKSLCSVPCHSKPRTDPKITSRVGNDSGEDGNDGCTSG